MGSVDGWVGVMGSGSTEGWGAAGWVMVGSVNGWVVMGSGSMDGWLVVLGSEDVWVVLGLEDG